MFGQRVQDPLLLLSLSLNGDWIWQSCLVSTFAARPEEAVNSTNFLHSSQKAWSTISKLTGRSRHSSYLCPISANSIASQLMKNRAQKMGTASRPQGSSARRCPIYERSQHLREMASLPFDASGACYRPQTPIWDWILFSWSLYYMLDHWSTTPTGPGGFQHRWWP